MSDDLTHASFFSGVGGLDMGLERAGWRTVSFSEIDPYASAVLAQRWPGIPNLGDITSLGARLEHPGSGRRSADGSGADGTGTESEIGRRWEQSGAGSAALWTGGFPCQDLSVAGKRRGMGAGTRSGLAYAFLDLVGRHHPRFVLLENVPGLLSSHGGRDMAALIGALVELGYGVGYRVLDARHFGVPQRRRRVFILGISPGGRAGAERASEVLSVGSRCRRHPPTGIEAGSRAAAGTRSGVDIARAVTGTSGKRHDDDTDTLLPDIVGALNDLGHHGWTANAQSVDAGHIVTSPIKTRVNRDGIGDEDQLVSQTSDPGRMRAPDGLAGRSYDRGGVADTLNSGGNNGGFRTESGAHLVAFNPYRTLERDGSVTSGYAAREVVDALHGPTGNQEPLVAMPIRVMGQTRAHQSEREAVQEQDGRSKWAVLEAQTLPLGLDSHRYRCCGNGVVADVAEWIGLRLAALAE